MWTIFCATYRHACKPTRPEAVWWRRFFLFCAPSIKNIGKSQNAKIKNIIANRTNIFIIILHVRHMLIRDCTGTGLRWVKHSLFLFPQRWLLFGFRWNKDKQLRLYFLSAIAPKASRFRERWESFFSFEIILKCIFMPTYCFLYCVHLADCVHYCDSSASQPRGYRYGVRYAEP